MRLNPCLARIHFDFSRYLDLAGMARTARRQLELAHSLAPNDLAIDRACKAAPAPPLTPEQAIARLKERMDAHDATPEAKAGAAGATRAIEARQRGDCQPVGEVTSTTLKMVDLSDGPARQYAVALDVLMKRQAQTPGDRHRLLRLTISRGSAISAGLIPEAEIKSEGIGDRGPANTFVTHVDDLRIGGREIRNCIVHVFEKRNVLDVDGLIGADVFSRYLVTLDTPSRELRLASLPSRPDEAGEAKPLAIFGDSGWTGVSAAPKDPPRDRYIAPEMKDWTRVYRLGHNLIVPTRIGNAPTKLFIMDTGTSSTLVSPQAAREVTHVDSNDHIRVHGINGDVNDVLQAEAVTLHFAGQPFESPRKATLCPINYGIMYVNGGTMNAANIQIGDWLGVQPPATDTEILRIVEGRLPPSVIKRLATLGLERAEIDEIVIASRTLQHRRSRRERLTIEESDRVLRTIRVLSSAEAIYGSRERALKWLRKPHARLESRAPLSLLKTDTGSRIVEELLIQIDEGIFV